MIRLGDSSWWLDPTGDGWWLLEVVGTGRRRTTQRHGPFTAIEHCLQQRAVALPDEVRAEIEGLVPGDDLGDLPVTDGPEKSGPT